MKTAELTGPKLAEWVARANGYTITKSGEAGRPTLIVGDDDGCLVGYIGGDYTPQYAPHVNWDHGGPLLEQQIMTLGCSRRGTELVWAARHKALFYCLTGPTAPIAICRAVVVGKFGETVPDEMP